MNIKFVLVAAASALTALPSWGQANIPVMGNTNITVSGLLTERLANSDISQGNAATGRIMPTETGVYDNTSRLIVASTSKITEGWNVIFRVESRFMANVRPGTALLPGLYPTTNGVVGTQAGLAVNDASGWADGDTWGGVSSPFGSIVFGKAGIYWADTLSAGYLAPTLEGPGESYRIWDVPGQTIYSLLSGYQTGTVSAAGVLTPTDRNILGNTRATNLVRYDSPLFKPGDQSLLQITLAWSKNPAGAQNNWVSNANGSTYEGGETVYGKALFNGYGFSASASYLDQKFQGVLASAANTELKAYRLGLSYKISGFKVGVVYDNSDMVNGLSTVGVLSDAKRSTYQVPVSYSFGDHALYATYTKAGDTSSLTGTGAKGTNFCYDYALTKRAFVGIIYSKLNNDVNAYYQPFLSGYSPFGASAIAKGESWREISLSFNYWF
jgi:predicted porin